MKKMCSTVALKQQSVVTRIFFSFLYFPPFFYFLFKRGMENAAYLEKKIKEETFPRFSSFLVCGTNWWEKKFPCSSFLNRRFFFPEALLISLSFITHAILLFRFLVYLSENRGLYKVHVLQTMCFVLLFFTYYYLS